MYRDWSQTTGQRLLTPLHGRVRNRVMTIHQYYLAQAGSAAHLVERGQELEGLVELGLVGPLRSWVQDLVRHGCALGRHLRAHAPRVTS